MDQLKDVHDVARILKVQELTVYRLVKRGELPHRRVGRTIRFTDADIEKYLEKIRGGSEE